VPAGCAPVNAVTYELADVYTAQVGAVDQSLATVGGEVVYSTAGTDVEEFTEDGEEAVTVTLVFAATSTAPIVQRPLPPVITPR